MEKWYICKYDYRHIQAPHLVKPVGVAYQKQRGDSETDGGFLDFNAFTNWLIRNDLCAFREGYVKSGALSASGNLPVIYVGA